MKRHHVPVDTRVHQALMFDRELLVRSILAEPGVDVNTCNAKGLSPLECAIRSTNHVLVRLILDAGAVCDTMATSMLLHRAVWSDNLGILELLLDAGVPPSSVDRSGRSALYKAIMVARSDMVRALVRAGSHIDMCDNGMTTPVILAIKWNRLPCLRVLLAAGAYRGCTDTTWADRHGHTELHTWLQTTRGWTRLHYLCEAARTHEVYTLLRSNETHSLDRFGTLATPLAAAQMASPPSEDLIRMLCTAAEPWAPSNHQLYPARFRAMVWALLCVRRRVPCIRRLGQAVWLYMISFLPRF